MPAPLSRCTRATRAITATIPFWTQHTVNNGGVAAIRWYQINPNPKGAPSLRSTGLISAANTHLYNAAIAPDRRVDGAIGEFGRSFVIGYTASGAAVGLNPRIVMASSVNEQPLSFRLVREAVGGYRDLSCPSAGQVCRWGDYSGATPDPRPGTTDRGAVWLTNQFAGGGTATTQANWRTRIWAARP